MEDRRGSEKVMGAWRARALSEDAVQEIADAFAKSPAKVERATVHGGGEATGLRMSVSYEGDDTPWCGNDILFWLKWHLKHGGTPPPPKIIIDGTPWPELLQMVLEFGQVEDGPGFEELPGEVAGGFRA